MYEFCRYVDDIADKNNQNKRKKLKKILNDLRGSVSNNSKLHSINSLVLKEVIYKKHIIQLLEGVYQDTKKSIRIKNDEELITYAYLVAGTVGLMMSSILKISDKVACKYAADLGIAFQLTNIARDIIEDAKINRVYFPQSWYKIKVDEIQNSNGLRKRNLEIVTKKLISLAENYYQSALKGLGFLSIRNRFAILLALLIYRKIGYKILKKNFSNLYKREIISTLEKLLWLGQCIILFLFNYKIHKKNFKHNFHLHKPIKKLIIY